MAHKYEYAGADVAEMVKELILKFHTEHDTEQTTFEILFAYAPENEQGDLVGCALKKDGFKALALVKINTLEDRVVGRGDFVLLIDGDEWPELTPSQRIAILDHELQHVALRRSVKGEVLHDTAGRPKLRLRKHDRHFGWFDSVALRRGIESIEVQQLRQLIEEAGQIYMPFIEKVGLPAPAGKTLVEVFTEEEEVKPVKKPRGKKAKVEIE